jgi:hypothetical protein
VVTDTGINAIKVIRPRPRVAIRMQDSMDVVKRAIISAKRNPLMDTALLDLTSMSFAMMEKVYAIVQAKASRNKKEGGSMSRSK